MNQIKKIEKDLDDGTVAQVYFVQQKKRIRRPKCTLCNENNDSSPKLISHPSSLSLQDGKTFDNEVKSCPKILKLSPPVMWFKKRKITLTMWTINLKLKKKSCICGIANLLNNVQGMHSLLSYLPSISFYQII